MTSAAPRTALVARTCLGIALSLSLPALTAYSAGADQAPARKSTGTLETSAGAYTFTPTSCSIYKEDGFDDIEIGGPGTAPDGEKFYFELSSTGNEMAIMLGVDGPFASPERQLKAGRFVSQEFTIEVSDTNLSASSLVLVDENGSRIDDNATLTIDCGA